MAGRLIGAWNPAEDSAGASISGALLNTYIAGTTTNKATYPTEADADALTNAHTNPVVADSAGRFAELWAPDGATYDLLRTTSTETDPVSFDGIVALGSADTGAIMRDFGADGRVSISASGGTVSIEAGDASPDNAGGTMRLGGWLGTTGDELQLDFGTVNVPGDLAVDGAFTTASLAADTITLGGKEIAGVELDSGTVTVAAAQLDVTLPTGYRHMRLEIINAYPATDAVANARLNFGAGILSGASDYYWTLFGGGGIDVADDADSEIQVTYNAVESTGKAANRFVFDIICPSGAETDLTLIDFTSNYKNSGAAREKVAGQAVVLTQTTRPTVFRFFYVAVNLSSCTWALYGIAGL